MHIAYSAVNHSNDQQQHHQSSNESEITLRYQAYLATCNKYNREIAAIQKYMPGWTPRFR